ncbi:MAG: hypothetical protein MPEBLZ_01707 [Candidatus Methanoperedens nitroreducens]|uniref:Uncharacterized protein n=1 Tax=Candidatus Methanoperedens nitratireducens TaxID=1392998 RepID=A0A0P8CKU3_9EURY|nr:MAG: hypothetical protein MPEBLZ_01707 [Candidatus Methanoperedens sp. BLZ1]
MKFMRMLKGLYDGYTNNSECAIRSLPVSKI